MTFSNTLDEASLKHKAIYLYIFVIFINFVLPHFNQGRGSIILVKKKTQERLYVLRMYLQL